MFFPFVSEERLPEPIPAQPSRTPPAASVSMRRTLSPAGWRFTACLVCDTTVRAESIIAASIKLVPVNSLSTTAWKDAAEGGRFNETGDVEETLQESENLQERTPGCRVAARPPHHPSRTRAGLSRWTLGLCWAGPDWDPAGLWRNAEPDGSRGDSQTSVGSDRWLSVPNPERRRSFLLSNCSQRLIFLLYELNETSSFSGFCPCPCALMANRCSHKSH